MEFETAVTILLSYEGGYVDNPVDPGGETNFGISKRAYPDLDIKTLTRDVAKAIYRKDYWEKVQANSLPPELRLIVFDCAVNQGVSAAISFLQQVLGVKVTGRLDDVTAQAVGSLDVSDLILRYAVARHNSYAANKNWTTFGRGWSRRLLDVSVLSMALLDTRKSLAH